ncbi:hypothetical protein, partial [Bacteroides pyogenes]|uniref:hypothetical protein n=1 Tax=Bacteroides pyogenes TaxID=310300 RepID=UPI001F328E0C
GTSTAYSGDMSYAGGTAYQEENYNVVKSTDNQSSTQNYSIIYRGITANSSTVSETSKSKLKKLMDATGDYSIVITSTSRSPYDQARIMYENISNTSVSAQKKIYGSTGDQVIDAYNPKLTREENISAMESKIRDIGASKVSKHCADPSVKNVLDISASSIDDPKKFEEELTNAGIYYLKENGCYHLEIDQ